ncbi:MAG: hypothetical protein FJY85_23895 [Deltaproteobacteria bacterium]|nr:hypothetical protein [Deltaproteobacteria bacterium]
MSAQPKNKLLLLISIRAPEDLLAVVESEGWHTVKDLFKKTGTSFNVDWNGKYVLDQDEIPWKVSEEEIAVLGKSKGRVVVLSGGKYGISGELTLYNDTDGSVYAMEKDLEHLLS